MLPIQNYQDNITIFFEYFTKPSNCQDKNKDDDEIRTLANSGLYLKSAGLSFKRIGLKGSSATFRRK